MVKLNSVWSLMICDQSKLNPCILVSITYHCKRMDLWCYGNLSLVCPIICWMTHCYHKVSSVRDLFQNLEVERRWSRAHAHASCHASINASPVDAHLDNFIRLLDSLCTNYNGAAFTLTLIRQFRSVYLLFGTHQFSHWNLNLANCVIIAATIAVNQDEFILLHFFKEVGEGESLLEVWIQRILYLLSLANLMPIVVSFFEK